MRRFIAPAVLGLAACSGQKGETGAPSGPDITGRYNVIIGGVTGCDNDPTWVAGWASGPLAVSGTPDALTFDFDEGMTFDGLVGADWKYRFWGIVTYNGATLDLSHLGEVSKADNGASKLDGTFTVTVNDDQFESNDCTLEAPMQAVGLTGG